MNALGFAMWRNRRSLSPAMRDTATLAMGTEQQAFANRASEPHLPRLRQNGTTSGSTAVASVAEKQAVNGAERKRQTVTADLDEEPSNDDELLSDQPSETGERLVLPR